MYKCLNPAVIGVSLDWEACLPLAKDNGFEGIDLRLDPAIPAARYRDALAQHGLKPGGMGLPFHMNDDQIKVTEALESLPSVCKRASEIGLTRLYTWIMPFSEHLTWKENFQFHVERLGMAARILADHGCRLGLEFIGPRTAREGHKYSFVHTLQGMLELAEAIGANVGLLLDAWHWYASLGTLGELHSLENQNVVYVHVNDAPAGVPIEQQQDLVRRLPGATGVIDIAGFLHALRQIGYDGPVVPEPFDQSLKALPPEMAVQRTGQAMQQVWEME